MTIRDNFIIQKLGTLMLANADLAAENVTLAQKCQEQTAAIAELTAKLDVALQTKPMAGGTSINGASGDGGAGGAAGFENAKTH